MTPRTLDLHDPAHLAALFRLQREAYAVEAAWIGSRDLPPLRESMEELEGSAESCLGLWDDRGLLAALAFELPEPVGGTEPEVWISRLVVDPPWARQGLGTALVRHLLATFPDRRVRVATGAANLPALRLYRKLGFEIDGVRDTPEGIPVAQLARKA